MQDDIKYLDKCINIIEANESEEALRKVHNELKLFTPVGMDETQSDIIWAHAWKTCTYDRACNPTREDIRKCDMLFCKMILKNIQHWK